MTMHSLAATDCRDLTFIDDRSIHLVVTHPPGFGCCDGESVHGQLSAISEYDSYLAALDGVWAECERVLSPGGYLACVVSPVAKSSVDLPTTADVQMRARRFGFDAKASIRWLESDRLHGDEADFIGRPNQPCREPILRSHDLLVMAKRGRRIVSEDVECASRMPAGYFAMCSSPVWLIPAETSQVHPQVFPLELAERLVRMYSYAGDTVLDPFAGSGTTNVAAVRHGRNSIGVEIDPSHFSTLHERVGATVDDAEIIIERLESAPRRL